MPNLEGTLFDGLDAEQLASIKWAAEQSQDFFCRLMFRAREHQVFRKNAMASLVNDTLDRVFSGELSRLIISMPPGMGKTLQCVIMFSARSFALNPRTRILHVSYSDTLVQQNSQAVRDTINLPEFQALWPIQIRQDSNAKGLWQTDLGGQFKASPAAGEVTGFRAGTLDNVSSDDLEDFVAGSNGEKAAASGALLIDDPLRPDDARSEARKTAVNLRFNNTLRSRLAHEGVPIILTGQRVNALDLSGYLLTGGGGEKWHHLMLPVLIERPAPEVLPKGATKDEDQLGRPWPVKSYPPEYTHGIPIKHSLPAGPLWALKYDWKDIDILRRDSRVWSAQYLQDPRVSENAVFQPTFFRPYEVRPRTLNIAIIGDPSAGMNAHSDRTAIVVIGVDEAGNKYLLDGVCHRMQLSERWFNLRRLFNRWHVGAMPGVQSCRVAWERFGMQADLPYFKERMTMDGPMFPIEEVSWSRTGSSSKEDRIERLEPDFKGGRFWLPAVVWRPESGGKEGAAYWAGSERGVTYREMLGPTRDMRDVAQAGEGFRVMDKPIRQVDENRQLYDLTILLMEELRDFPNAKYDDLSDAVSRIYDLNMPVPNRREDDEVRAANEALVS